MDSTVDEIFFGVFDYGSRPGLEVFGFFGPFTPGLVFVFACMCMFV